MKATAWVAQATIAHFLLARQLVLAPLYPAKMAPFLTAINSPLRFGRPRLGQRLCAFG
jgi:hypothetical protein